MHYITGVYMLHLNCIKPETAACFVGLATRSYSFIKLPRVPSPLTKLKVPYTFFPFTCVWWKLGIHLAGPIWRNPETLWHYLERFTFHTSMVRIFSIFSLCIHWPQYGRSRQHDTYTTYNVHTLLYPPKRSLGGVYWIHPVRPSVCPSVRPSVRGSVSGW